MPKKYKKEGNLKLAGLFVLLVLGLVIISIFFKAVFLIRDSKFDGNNKFNIEIVAKGKTSIVSFAPANKSLTILWLKKDLDNANLARSLAIPIDGKIITGSELTKNNLSFVIFKSIFPFGNKINNLTTIDLIRLLLSSRTVSDSSIYEKEISNAFNQAQQSTIISLVFLDAKIYQESKAIQVVNASDIYGLGNRLANLISNMGGNVVLVSSGDKKEKTSKIIYSGNLSYTVKKISSYLNMPLEKTDKKSIADVIIIIGEDRVGEVKF